MQDIWTGRNRQTSAELLKNAVQDHNIKVGSILAQRKLRISAPEVSTIASSLPSLIIEESSSADAIQTSSHMQAAAGNANWPGIFLYVDDWH